MKKFIYHVAVSFCLILLSNGAYSQIFEINKSDADTAKQYLLKYINMFDTFINTPGRYAENRLDVIKMFRNNDKKQITNFITAREFFKGELSPEKLLQKIEQEYPSGFGMDYVKDSVEYLQTRNGFFFNSYAYKIPVEYSGMRADGSFLNYKKDQYFFVTVVKGKHQITGIHEQSYYNRKFKNQLFRNGLFFELYLNPVSIGGFPDGNQNFINYSGDASFNTYSKTVHTYFKNFGFSIFHMLKPWYGIGFNYSSSNYIIGYDYEGEYINNYSVNPLSKISYTAFSQDIHVKSKTISVFSRLQGGWSVISFSLDLGAGIQQKPLVTNFIDGEVRYYGIDETTGNDITQSEQYGYRWYEYDNEKTHTETRNSRKFALIRGNIHIQPSKYYNFRLSAGTQLFFENLHTKAWHMWDIHAICSEDQISYQDISDYHFTVEFALGIHINEVLAKFNIL